MTSATDRLLSLKGEPERDIVVKGWAGFNSVDWAADGKSLFVSSQSPTSSTLLVITLFIAHAVSGQTVARAYADNDGNAHVAFANGVDKIITTAGAGWVR